MKIPHIHTQRHHIYIPHIHTHRTKTRLTTLVGSIKHTEEEVVHDLWADVQADLVRRGLTGWEDAMVAFLAKKMGVDRQVWTMAAPSHKA